VANDVFRLANAPADARYDPREETATSRSPGGSGAPAVARSRPTLVLKAIVGGPPWQAAVDGIPGQPPGTVVRAGMRFEHLVIRLVSRDSVVVQLPDTTWALTFRAQP
jgi:hypothetical protein